MRLRLKELTVSLYQIWLTRLGFLVSLALVLVSCQQQPLAVQSTPTVAPSPTPGEKIALDGISYACGPLDMRLGILRENRVFLAWTPNGTELVFNYLPVEDASLLIYPFNTTAIWLVDAAGSRLQMLVDANPGHEMTFGHHADISPDGAKLVYASCEIPFPFNKQNPERKDFNYEVAVIRIDGTGQRQLTKNSHLDHYPVWSPDGSRIAYLAAPGFGSLYSEPEGLMLFTMAADGSEVQQVAPVGLYGQTQAPPVWWPEGERLPFYGLTLEPPEWSPDGERIAFLANADRFDYFMRSLYTVRADGSEIMLLSEDVVSVPAWSPDGQRLAVAKTAGDDVGLFILAADGSDLQLITTILSRELLNWWHSFGGTIPVVSWSPDGSQLLYSCWDGACIIDLESGEVIGLAEYGQSVYFAPYAAAWSPDGARVAIYTPGDMRPQLYTVAPDGTDRRDLIRLDADGNLAPANPPDGTQ